MLKARKLVVASGLSDLPQVMEFVRQACLDAGLDDDAVFACELATDEACTNIIEHAYAGRNDGEIQVTCSCSEGIFEIRLRDHGRAFEPTAVTEPVFSRSLAERQSGGLGLHFMRSLMDEVHFEFGETDGNTLIMKKQVGARGHRQ